MISGRGSEPIFIDTFMSSQIEKFIYRSIELSGINILAFLAIQNYMVGRSVRVSHCGYSHFASKRLIMRKFKEANRYNGDQKCIWWN